MTAQRAARRLGFAAFAAAAAVVALWLGQLATGGDAALPPSGLLLTLSRTAVVAAVLLALAWGAARFAAAWAAGGGRRRRAVALAALLALALALRFTGLGHELIDRPYLDEGTYYHHATEIDQGHLFRSTFVYPHLVYYADALWLWVAGLFRGALLALAARWGPGYGWLEVTWWWLRWLPALAGAAVVVPAFRAAETLAETPGTPSPASRKVGGTWGSPLLAGVFAGMAVAVGPLWNEISHLNVSDLPAAFFAAVSFAGAARLLREESTRGYLGAGAAAGLAAVAKYPAGVVALAVAAVWLRHRLAARRWGWGLAWAALAALGVFVACMPSLFVFPGEALFGGRGILFGVRQYAGGGWIGVQPESHLLYYADLVRGELGWAALAAAGAGLFCLARGERRRFAWMLPFPLAYLVLVTAMNLVVQRNLLPAIPPLAALAGVAVAALVRRAGGALGRWRNWPRPLARAAAPLAVVLLLLPPAFVSLGASRALAAPSTRERARAWIEANVPPGSALLVESYGPRLAAERYTVWNLRFAARVPLESAIGGGVDYLVLSATAYQRFLDPAQHSRPHHAAYAAWYERVFAELPLAARFPPAAGVWGPEVRIHGPLPAAPSAALPRQPAGVLFVPDAAMRVEDARAIAFTRPGQWCAAKLDLAAGRWRLRVVGAAAGTGTVRLATRGGEERGAWRLTDGGTEIVVAEPGRYLVYLELPPGSRVDALDAERENGAADLSY